MDVRRWCWDNYWELAYANAKTYGRFEDIIKAAKVREGEIPDPRSFLFDAWINKLVAAHPSENENEIRNAVLCWVLTRAAEPWVRAGEDPDGEYAAICAKTVERMKKSPIPFLTLDYKLNNESRFLKIEPLLAIIAGVMDKEHLKLIRAYACHMLGVSNITDEEIKKALPQLQAHIKNADTRLKNLSFDPKIHKSYKAWLASNIKAINKMLGTKNAPVMLVLMPIIPSALVVEQTRKKAEARSAKWLSHLPKLFKAYQSFVRDEGNKYRELAELLSMFEVEVVDDSFEASASSDTEWDLTLDDIWSDANLENVTKVVYKRIAFNTEEPKVFEEQIKLLAEAYPDYEIEELKNAVIWLLMDKTLATAKYCHDEAATEDAKRQILVCAVAECEQLAELSKNLSDKFNENKFSQLAKTREFSIKLVIAAMTLAFEQVDSVDIYDIFSFIFNDRSITTWEEIQNLQDDIKQHIVKSNPWLKDYADSYKLGSLIDDWLEAHNLTQRTIEISPLTPISLAPQVDYGYLF